MELQVFYDDTFFFTFIVKNPKTKSSIKYFLPNGLNAVKRSAISNNTIKSVRYDIWNVSGCNYKRRFLGDSAIKVKLDLNCETIKRE